MSIERLERPDLVDPVADLGEGRWKLWVCTRCLKCERELPHDTRHQIAHLRAGTWPTPGMSRAWPNNCYCGGVLREVEVMASSVAPGGWECPDCGVDMGVPTCAECEALAWGEDSSPETVEVEKGGGS
jgi:hypothetical protein